MTVLPYPDAASFRHALLARLKAAASRGRPSMQVQQQRFLMERLLARLFAVEPCPWVLKGGFGLDLRYRPDVRVTRDLDLAVQGLGSAQSTAPN